ncbi:MAG TPA: A/G-specific adenine glycosylase [Pirellulales bacterium]|jgi:A/G-specific adenine glycosylase|nr:A/G-specific adenine glycosylase [Pirellulales bacterium]
MSTVAKCDRIADATWRAAFRRKLLAWYGRAARDLPWRRTSDPYAIWVSEIMLQQTQMATVIGYYERFLAALPSVFALAAAPEEQVLRLWEGLGYYRRARQLHRAAQVIVAQHGGELPRDVDTLRTLPGIGRYTAGAIASIAFDARAPILEANTLRLLARLLAYRGDVTETAGQRTLWEFAEALLPRRGAGRFNQALMELGSLVCTPQTPRCVDCPVRELCPTFVQRLQAEIPAPRRKPLIEDVREVAVVVRRGCKVLVGRKSGGRWDGLWDFPRFSISEAETADQLRTLTGLTVHLIGQLATLKHGVTRFRITLSCLEAEYRSGRCIAGWRWIDPTELHALPMPVTGRKLAGLVPRGRQARLRSR